MMVGAGRRLWVAAVVLVAACGDSSPVADDDMIDAAPAADGTSVTLDAREDPRVIRRFDVSGVEVWAGSAFVELPDEATRVEFATMILDDGDGPMACLGGVAESYPPQCGGPRVEGLVLGESWTETASGVTWGVRTIVVSWPPVDGGLSLIEDRPFEPAVWPDAPLVGLPAECEGRSDLLGPDVIAEWAAAHPDRADVAAVDPSQTIGILRVTGDVEEFRAELTRNGMEPCVMQVRYSRNELMAAQESLRPLYDNPEFGFLSSGAGNSYNRLTVTVPVADRAAVERILEVVSDPGILRIDSAGLILDGR